MIDIHILKEHIERIEPGQRIELNDLNGEPSMEITKTKHGLLIGFSNSGHPYNALLNMSQPVLKVENGNLNIDSLDNITGKYYASLSIYDYNYFSMEVKE